jgi:prephenate dehydrogenase
MGGAIALALGKHCGVKAERLLAWDPDQAALAQALEQGLIGGAYTGADQGFCPGAPPGKKPNMLGLCDLVFLCLNPSTLIRFLGRWMGAFKSGALITDIAGIKGNIARTVEQSLREDLDFIPGHPMAGAEGGGFAKASLCRFQGKNYILTPLKRNRRENLDYLKALIRRMGFSRITETSPEDHDGKIAFTSQLCHVIAAALIDCDDDPGRNRFGGGSFEDLTRIAMLNAPMWTELFMENRAALLGRLARFEQSLGELKALIAGEDAPALETRLQAIRERRAAMNE